MRVLNQVYEVRYHKMLYGDHFPTRLNFETQAADQEPPAGD
jgi:hypothetical protein